MRWHCAVIPVLMAGLLMAESRRSSGGRARWRGLCAAFALLGAIPTFVGLQQPWTTMRNGAPPSSFAAVRSDSPVLVSAESRAAARMVRVGRHLEGQLLAGYALRRDPRDRRALAAAVEAAASRNDRDALRASWRMARAVEWSASDYAHLERRVAQVLGRER